MLVLILGTPVAGAVGFDHDIRHLLWYIAILGSLTSTIFAGMALFAALRYVRSGRKLRAEASAAAYESLPAVSILKPVCGMEPRLEETLESFFRQDYPDYEIIFGARHAGDEALAVIA